MNPGTIESEGMGQSYDGGKVKRAKKRSKLGCVPCAKRRQKCDREQPCSSCVARGTVHLCKRATIPDGPSRPPRVDVDLAADDGAEDHDEDEDEDPLALRSAKLGLNENRHQIKMLSMRIKSLESRVVASGSGDASGSKRPVATLATGNALAGAASESVYHGGPFAVACTGVGGIAPGGSLDYLDANTSSVDQASGPIADLNGAAPYYAVSPAPSSTCVSVSSPKTQTSQIRLPARPQTTRRLSEASGSFRIEPVPQDGSYNSLATISLGHRGEFIGRGSLLCTLHSIRSTSKFRLGHAESTGSTSISPLYTSKFAQSLLPSLEIQHLIQYIPPMQSGNLILDAFFKEVNWRYGIPEKWFQGACWQMWNHLQNPNQNQGFQINMHWLCLLFSILACAPQPGESSTLGTRPPNTHDSGTYFVCARAARRLAEDNYLDQSMVSSSSSPADGGVLGCLAIPLLCDFLAERGRVSEAWKLIGGGIRSAQAAGMHRDPESQLWSDMSDDEKLLRRRAWWGLYIWDRLYSYILGRPQMIRKENVDVMLPSTSDSKGRKNCSNLGQGVMIQLANLIGEVLDKCMGVERPTCSILTEMDEKFKNWEEGIPAEYRSGRTPEQDIVIFVGQSPADIRGFTRQRYMITTWYRLGRLKLYTTALTGQHTPSPPQSPSEAEDRAEKCIRFALELIKFQCDTFDRMKRSKLAETRLGGNWYFEGCLSLFEATLALLMALTRFPTRFLVSCGVNMTEDPSKGLKLEYEEMTRVLSRVVDAFSEVVKSERGEDGTGDGKRAEIASKALEALQALMKEHWWKLDPRGGGVGLAKGIGPETPLAPSPQEKASPARVASTIGGTGAGVLQGGHGMNFTMRDEGPVHQLRPVQVYPSSASPFDTQTIRPTSQPHQTQYSAYPAAYRDQQRHPATIYPPPYAQMDRPPDIISKMADISSAPAGPTHYGQGASKQRPGATSSSGGYDPQNQSHFPQPQGHSETRHAFTNVSSPVANEHQPYEAVFPFVPLSPQLYHQTPQQFPTPPQLSGLYSTSAQQSTAAGVYSPTSAGGAQSPLASGGLGMEMVHGTMAPPTNLAPPTSGSNVNSSPVSSLDPVQLSSMGVLSDFSRVGMEGSGGVYYEQ